MAWHGKIAVIYFWFHRTRRVGIFKFKYTRAVVLLIHKNGKFKAVTWGVQGDFRPANMSTNLNTLMQHTTDLNWQRTGGRWVGMERVKKSSSRLFNTSISFAVFFFSLQFDASVTCVTLFSLFNSHWNRRVYARCTLYTFALIPSWLWWKWWCAESAYISLTG